MVNIYLNLTFMFTIYKNQLFQNMKNISFLDFFDTYHSVLTFILEIVFQFHIYHIIIIVLAKTAFVANKQVRTCQQIKSIG